MPKLKQWLIIFSGTILVGCGGSPLESDAMQGSGTILLSSRTEVSFVPLARNPSADAVNRLYRAGLGRPADPEGLRWWAHQLDMGQVGLQDVAGALQDSPEFRQRFGQPDSLEYVRQLYRNVLQREPEPEGLYFHAANLDNGRTNRAKLLLEFSESEERLNQEADSVGSPGQSLRHTQADWSPVESDAERGRGARRDVLENTLNQHQGHPAVGFSSGKASDAHLHREPVIRR